MGVRSNSYGDPRRGGAERLLHQRTASRRDTCRVSVGGSACYTVRRALRKYAKACATGGQTSVPPSTHFAVFGIAPAQGDRHARGTLTKRGGAKASVVAGLGFAPLGLTAALHPLHLCGMMAESGA